MTFKQPFFSTIFLALFSLPGLAWSQTITSVAGGALIPTEPAPYTSEEIGDGGDALSAYLHQPFGVSTISERIGGVNVTTVYIADKENNRIRRVSPDGTITTVVGNGEPEFSGDGGPATEASLEGPEGVAAVKEEIGGVLQTVLYISDTHNNRIRRAVVGGNITTFAGGGTIAPRDADGVLATSASVFLPSQIVAFRVRRVIVASRPRRPVFATRVYFADTANGLIRKVENNFITRVAGRIPGPFDDLDEIGDGGLATAALLQLPFGLAVRPRLGGDIIYISDTGHHRIRKVQGGIISTYAGGGSVGALDVSAAGIPATDIELQTSHALEVTWRGTLYISDAPADRLYKVQENPDGSGTLTNFAGNGLVGYDASLGHSPIGDGGPALEAVVSPKGLDMDKWGNLFIADTSRGLIRKVSP